MARIPPRPSRSLRHSSARLALLLLALLSVASAFAQSDCRNIPDPTQRLACYDKQYGVATTPATPTPQPPAPPTVPQASDRRWSVSFEEGAFFSSNGNANLGIVQGGPTGTLTTTAAPIPTSPGFIGLFTIQNAQGDPINGTRLRGPQSSLQLSETMRLGYWLDRDHSHGLDFEVVHSSGSAEMRVRPDGLDVAVPGASLSGLPAASSSPARP